MKERDWSVWIFGAVVAVVLAAFAWMLIAPGSDHAGPSRSTDRVTLAGRQASGTPSPSPQPGETSDQLQRCSQAAVALKHTLHHAAGSVAQWEVHVGAMNKLVTGVISLRQATAFWNQTRVGVCVWSWSLPRCLGPQFCTYPAGDQERDPRRGL
jgi:hypothetical protein